MKVSFVDNICVLFVRLLIRRVCLLNERIYFGCMLSLLIKSTKYFTPRHACGCWCDFYSKVFNKEVRFGSMGRPPLPHPCASIVQLFLAIHIISSSGSEFFFESLAHVSIRLCLARELKGVVIPTKIDLSFYNLFLYCRASYRPGASSSGSTCCLIWTVMLFYGYDPPCCSCCGVKYYPHTN